MQQSQVEHGGYSILCRDVKDACEGILQLFCTVSRDVTWYVVWTSGLARVNAGKGPLYFISRRLESLVRFKDGSLCAPLV